MQDSDFEWSLLITKVDNGYQLKGHSGSDKPMKFVIEDSEKDELKSSETLLRQVMEYFNFQGSKHDPERLFVVRKKQGRRNNGLKTK